MAPALTAPRSGGAPFAAARGKKGLAMDILAAAALVAGAQRRAAPLLDGFVASGKLPPSLLFTGPEGAGKELMAIRLAHALLRDPRVGRLEHPDLHLVYPVPPAKWEQDLAAVIASRREDVLAEGEFGRNRAETDAGARARSLGIELARHVIETLAKHPFEGGRSVVILFEAHLATTEAQNALLKLLEEPPRPAAIVLVTEHPERLLPTVRSRCQEVRFDPLPAAAIAEFLVAFKSVEPGEAARIAALAQGNLRRAARRLEGGAVQLWKDAASILSLIAAGQPAKLLAEAEQIARSYSREETLDLLEEVSLLLGVALRHRDGAGAGPAGEALAETLGPACLAAMARRDLTADIGAVARSRESLRRNADLELTLAHLFLDLTGAWY